MAFQCGMGVVVEDDAFLGPHMVFTNDREPRAGYPKDLVHTLISKGASIGAGAVILCGLTIGKYATVGAGSIVTHDVPEHYLVYGNPARQHGWVCRCGLKLADDGGNHFECKCGLKYELKLGEKASLSGVY